MQTKTNRFNKIPLPLIGIGILAYFGFVLSMFGSSATAAVSGAKSNIFPDVAPAGQSGDVRAIVQIVPDNTLLRARSTIASIYIPQSAVDSAPGQSLSVSLTIVGGCDSGFWAYSDINGDLGNTYYGVLSPSGYSGSFATTLPVAYVDSDAVCNSVQFNSRGDVAMSFLATPPPVAPNPRNDEFRTHGDDGTAYYIYRFNADAWAANENNQYQNNFRVRVNTPGGLAGVAAWVGTCDSISFPKSCPPPRAFTDIYGRNRGFSSFVYSSFYGITNPYGIELGINSACQGKGAISIFDLDIPNVAQPNMIMTLKKNGATEYTIPYIAIDMWREGIPGFLNAHPGFGSENDAYMDLPSTDLDLQALSNFSPATQYTIGINGVSGANAIQFLAEMTTCPVPPNADKPIGFVDSCILQGNETILFGWGYDDNGTNNNQPRVRLNLTGLAQQGFPTDQDYRNTEINTYLNNNNYGTSAGARTNRYGFRAVYSGLAKGTVYNVSGTVVNEGAGTDQAIGINGDVGPPGGGVVGSSGFPGGRIPDGCLPVAVPSGVIVATCSATGGNITVSVNASNPASAGGGNVGVTLTVNHSGGPSSALGIGSGAIVLNNSSFPTNFGGPDSTRTVSGTVLSVANGVTVNMTPVVYSCPAVPECEINTQSVNIGEQFYITVTLRNRTMASTPVSGPATYTVYRNGVAVPGLSGSGRVYNDATKTYSDFSANPAIPPGGSMVVRSNPPPITIAVAGSYDVRWDVATAPGVNAVGECGSIAGGQGAIDASVKPYVRFYGNDIVAGGGYGNCTNSAPAHVRGYGTFGSGARTHGNYKGSAVELAVFATGDIEGVLPGSQDTGRTSLTELSFSNKPPFTGEFGGSFGEVICADDYWADRTGGQLPTAPAGDPMDASAVMVNINSLTSGDYTYAGNVYIYADNTPVPAGKRVTIYVQGNTVVGRPGGPATDRLAYDTAVPWATISQIPLVKIVTMGNLFIDDNIVQLDGLYVAVPDPNNVLNTGEIHTCSAFGLGLDLTRPVFEEAFVATTCTQKLVVNGAFVAKRVHLLRSNGNIEAGVPGEAYTSANIAEVFRFSPEMYLALLSKGDGPRRFDSILSLPPAL